MLPIHSAGHNLVFVFLADQRVRGAGGPAAGPLTREEYVEKHKPRIEFQPWSAPAFDDRTVQSQPELYCMASGTTTEDTT